MQVGVIADTHDNVSAVQQAVDHFESADIDTVIHCGDVIAPPVLPFFEGFEFHLVLGNNDGEVNGLRSGVDDLANGSTVHGRFARLRLDGAEIAVLHGEDLEEVRAYARTGAFEYVLYGHHHEAAVEEVSGTIMLNPGAHFPTVSTEHRSVAIIDTNEHSYEFIQLD